MIQHDSDFTVLHIKDDPYLPCSAVIKFHSITKLQHTTQTQHCSCTAQFAYSQDKTISAMLSMQLHCSNPQHNSLSKHIKMHYTPTTIPTPLPSTTLLCTQLTNTKHINCLSGGKIAQDVGMVLWCHSHLVWLVFEVSIPTCTCFPSENFL